MEVAEDTGPSIPTAAAKKPKKVPSRHRHITVPKMLEDGLLEQVLASTKDARTREQLVATIMGRLSYRPSELPRLRSRVERFNRNCGGRRMPSHIKTAATLVMIVDQAVDRRFNQPDGPKEPALKKMAKAVKAAVKEARA